jgi:HlyD family secretion protein
VADALAAYQIADALKDLRVGYSGWQQILDEVNLIFDSAQTELEDAQQAYDQILAEPQYEDILQARARVSVARERYDLALDYLAQQYSGVYSLEVSAADALVAQAQAGLDQADALILQAQTALDRADAGVAQALAALNLVNLQLEKTQILSPISGVVLAKAVEAGEMIGAGFTALTIGDLSSLTVTVYIPENRYGQVSLGDMAELSIDSYPDEIFQAQVIYISDQAEYTPRNVQTQEERQNTVYAVKLSVTDREGMLIPGMPADVTLNP